MAKSLVNANINWRDAQTPVSQQYDDVYFNSQDALAEISYVFLDGNRLPERWQQSDAKHFTIGETGFGSGLNFLLSWQRFMEFRQANPTHPLRHLHFISVEKYPLTLPDVQQIQQNFTPLQPLAKQLQQHWLPNRSGRHHIDFEQISLQVYLGDISEYAPALQRDQQQIDAWFFDGFSPAKNPAMWQAELFQQLYQVTAINGTFATFTAASSVRRNLLQAGFSISKRRGFGCKREMLIGQKTED